MTLTETATITKRFLRVFLVLGAAFIAVWIIFLIVYNNIIVPYQRSQVKPEKRFGPLALPNFPPTLMSSALTYSLDTTSGGLPTDFPKLMNVYFLPPAETTLLAPDRARQLATTLNFTQGPEILSPTQYRFTDTKGGNLVIDLSNGNFSYQRSPTTQPDIPQDEVLADESKLGLDFKGYLNQKGLLKPGLEAGTLSVIYDQGNNKNSTTGTVTLWPNPIGKYPIVTTDPTLGLIHVTMTKYQPEQYRYLNLKYVYWPVDLETFSTYSLKPISEAYTQLQQGAGIIVKANLQSNKASVARVYLAYFMSESYQSFLEPVYVFESDQFTAYIKALTDDSYTQ